MMKMKKNFTTSGRSEMTRRTEALIDAIWATNLSYVKTLLYSLLMRKMKTLSHKFSKVNVSSRTVKNSKVNKKITIKTRS